MNSVMRFILFDSVLAKECRIRESWSRRQGPGRRYFVWQILLFLSWIAGLTILIGIPAGFAFVVGWLRNPKEHMIPLILGGMALFFMVMLFVVAQLLVHVMTKDFVVPQMALEGISAIEGWRQALAPDQGGEGKLRWLHRNEDRHGDRRRRGSWSRFRDCDTAVSHSCRRTGRGGRDRRNGGRVDLEPLHHHSGGSGGKLRDPVTSLRDVTDFGPGSCLLPGLCDPLFRFALSGAGRFASPRASTTCDFVTSAGAAAAPACS